MTAPILRIDAHDNGGHTVTVGTRDFNQARMRVADGALGESAVRTVADLLYDWPVTLKAKPRRRKRT